MSDSSPLPFLKFCRGGHSIVRVTRATLARRRAFGASVYGQVGQVTLVVGDLVVLAAADAQGLAVILSQLADAVQSRLAQFDRQWRPAGVRAASVE